MAINIPIVSEFDDKGLKLANKAFGTFGDGASKVSSLLKASVVPALIGVGVAALGFTKGLMPAIQSASDLQENTSKIKVIFGDAGDAITQFAKTAATEIGQSQNTVLAAAGTFGTFGKAAGLSGEALATFTTEFVTLSADLASFNNSTPQEAIDAIGSALRGEAEPLRKFGVLLNDATLKAAAMKIGIYDGSGALTAQQKILAAQEVIYKSTGDAQGDFARTSDGLANQQRILSAQIENVKTKIGEMLLPAFTKIVKFLTEKFVPAIDIGISKFKDEGMAGAAIYFAAAFGDTTISVLNDIRALILGFIKLEQKVVSAGSPFFAFVDIARAFGDAVTGGDGIITIEQQLINRTNQVNDSFDTLIATIGRASVVLNAAPSQVTGINNAYENWGKKIAGVKKEASDLLDPITKLTGASGTNKTKVKENTEALKDAAEAAKKFKDAMSDASKTLQDEMNIALDLATTKLKTAEDNFNTFKNTVDGAIRSGIDFMAAYELGNASDKFSFGSALDEQLKKTEEFATTINKLRIAGLSESAITEVMKAGVDAGTAIGKSLLNGQDAILKANKLMETLDKIAKETAEAAAQTYYGAGLKTGQAYMQGIKDAMAGANYAATFATAPADLKAIGAAFQQTVATGIPFVSPITTPIVDRSTVRGGTGASGAVTINVNGGISTSPQIAKAVYNAMLEYKQYYGPLTALAE